MREFAFFWSIFQMQHDFVEVVELFEAQGALDVDELMANANMVCKQIT